MIQIKNWSHSPKVAKVLAPLLKEMGIKFNEVFPGNMYDAIEIVGNIVESSPGIATSIVKLKNGQWLIAVSTDKGFVPR